MPDSIGRYRITGRLGEGGMGLVSFIVAGGERLLGVGVGVAAPARSSPRILNP
jgi:hypothetical protein